MSETMRNVKEAAAYLGLRPKTLYAMTAARAVPFTKIGKHIRFSQEHLDEIVEAGYQPVIDPAARMRVVGAQSGRLGTHPPAGPSTPSPPPGPKLPSARSRRIA